MRILRWAGRFWTGVLVVTVALAGLLLGLRVVLPFFGAPPTLHMATPADQSASVTIRAPLTLQFDQPMNPRSVEAALQISPALAWTSAWDASRTTLTLSPTVALQPATEYQIALGSGALSQRFRALAAPFALRFRTAQAPAVVAALPANGAADVPLASPISITFSREIVRPEATQKPGTLPALRFEPPLAGQATWLDSTTVLFRPAAPLQAGTRYRATLAAGLSDMNGGQLGAAYSWEFSTAAPRLIALAPADGARMVPPSATIALTLSQPLALDALRATLAFSPTITGALGATTLPDGRQRITLTPDAPLRAATTYTGTLHAGGSFSAGALPLVAPAEWRFSTAPQPTLTARFPGEGQMLPNDQEIRLVFTTPMGSDAVRAAMQLDPPAPNIRVSASASEVRIRADLRAATVYTLTLPADLADISGVALGQAYQMRFVTAPAGSALELPELVGNVAQARPDAAGGLLLRRTNLSALEFELYQLDEATLVRLLGFRPDDWPGFQPERYGQAQLRAWRMPLSDPLNTAVDQRLPLTNDRGEPLPAGAYYLRIHTLEGPRADIVLLVSDTRLSLQAAEVSGGGAALVWATSNSSGELLAGLPIALYQGGALVRQATTDAQGLAQFGGLGSADEYVAVAGGSQPGVALRAPSQGRSPLQARLFLAADRSAYAPGETVQLAGFVRASSVGPFPAISLSAVGPAGERLYQGSVQPGVTGIFTASMALPAGAQPGSYTLSARAGGGAASLQVAVQQRPAAPLRVEVQPPGPLLGGNDVAVHVAVATPEGLPLAGATITWTLTAEGAPFSGAGAFVFGDDERATTPAEPRTGVAQSDAKGQFTLTISDIDLADVPLHYRFVAEASGPAGAAGVGAGEFDVLPAASSVGIRPLGRLFTIGRPSTVELFALDAAGRPAPRTPIRVEVYERSWEQEPVTATQPDASLWVPRDRIAFTRSVVAGTDGRATLQLTLPRGGAYRLRASTPASAANASYSAVSLWASAPGFTGWRALPAEQPLLIADQPAYRHGDTATLLLAGLNRAATLLVTYNTAAGPHAETRTVRASEPFTLTLPADDTPAVTVVALAAPRDAAAPPIASLAPPPAASALLPLTSDRASLQVAIAADQRSYLPDGTATLTVTTTDSAGQGIPADVVLAIAGAVPADSGPIEQALQARPAPFQAGAPTGPTTLSVAATGARRAATPAEAPGFWRAGLRTSASGVLTVTVQLPHEPAAIYTQVWAASADRAGQARATLPISQPVEIHILAPPAFRAGDQADLIARVRNTDALTHTVGASLAIAGLALPAGGERIQPAELPPGAQRQFVWRARVLEAAGVRGAVTVLVDGAPFQTQPIEQPIIADAVPAPANRGIAIARDYLEPQTARPLDLAALRAGQLVRVRITLVNTAALRNLTIDEPLPANAMLMDAPPGALGTVAQIPARLTFTLAELGPGIVQYEYTIRLSAAGSYHTPATIARGAGGAQAAGPAADLLVSVP